MLVRCTLCNGRGRVPGLGYVWMDCKHCEGKGKFEQTKPIKPPPIQTDDPLGDIIDDINGISVSNDLQDFLHIPEIKRSRGRPRKAV